MRLQIGDPAPAFVGLTGDGKTIGLRDFAGKKLVLYFYPKDDTPGCTRQACSLRDYNAQIKERGAEILGVSTQDAASHERFSRKHRLNFPLLADADKAVSQAYGAMGGGGLLGVAMDLLGLARRITFIIDEQGRIAQIIDSPDCSNHAREVLGLL
ncbi:MAG: peroxiredoxin [Gammaproteobacteria bacterium]|nr:peroxiredoxin [Gammaproteobacteria bacterium]MCP5459975.1 peroxiredoxin [Gammaproteobacteria bacterium]